MDCPYCGRVLTEVDHAEPEEKFHKLWIQKYGWCENCQKGFSYTAEYALAREFDIERDY